MLIGNLRECDNSDDTGVGGDIITGPHEIIYVRGIS
jgi:hypothetical protein